MRKLLVRLGVLIAAALLWAAPARADNHTLSGKVFGGGSGLSGASVEALQDGTTTVVASSTTSGSGQYSLSLADGTYDLRVSPPAGSGYGQETVQNIVMSGADRNYDVILLSASGGVVSGAVTGRGGNALLDVYVYAYSNNTGQYLGYAVTNAAGQYSLSVGNGTVRLDFSPNTQSANAPRNWSASKYNITVSGATTVNLQLPVISVTGTVKGEDGVVLSGASVSANMSGSNAAESLYYYSSMGLTTDSAGHYQMLLLAGSGSFNAYPPSGTPYTPISQSGVSLSADTVHDLILPKAVTVSGTVKGLGSQPLADVYVYAYTNNTGQYLGYGVTNASGQYSVPVSPGSVRLDFSPNAQSANAPRNWSASKYNITVSGATTVNLQLPVISVTGTVKGEDGVVLSGASVSANMSGSNAGESLYYYSSMGLTTDSAGHYQMLLLAGSGSFNAYPPSGTPYTPISQSGVSLSADTVHDLILPKAVTVSGTVKGLGSQPLGDVYVYAYTNNTGQYLGYGVTNASGQYSAPVSPGSVRLDFSPNAQSVNAPRNWSASKYNITVSGATTVDLQLPVVRLDGSVTDSNGAGVPGVSVSTNLSGSDQTQSLYYYASTGLNTDTSGVYSMLLLRGSGSLNVYPPSQSGFLPASIPGFSMSGDLTQRIILQHPDLAPPQIVAGPLVVHLSDTSVSISWTTSEPASSIVQFGIGGLSQTITDLAMTTEHAVTLQELAELSTYVFRVGSADVAGNGPTYSAPGSFNTQGAPGDITAPAISDGPTVVFVDQTSAIVQWTTDEPASSLADYGLTAALGSTIDGDPAHFRQVHRVKLTGLAADTEYSAQVRSTDPDGNAVVSSVFTFRTQAVPDTLAPVITEGPAVVSVTDTKIVIGWTTNEPATSGVSYNDGSRFDLAADATLTRTHQMTLSNLSASTLYHVTVSSTDAVGNGPTVSAAIDVTTSATPDTTAPVISNLRVIDITTTAAVVVWTTDERASSLVNYGTASGAPDGVKADLASVTEHRLTLTGLQDGTVYYLTAVSIDASGNRRASSELSFRTESAFVDAPPSAPGPITAPASPTRAATFSLSWGASTDDVALVSYEVIRDGQVIATGAPEITSFEESSAAEGSHIYQIRATDSAGHAVVSAVLTLVIDRTAPEIVVPDGVVATAVGTLATVAFAVTASDNSGVPVVAVCSPASGSPFPVGTTTVTCTASDAAGNAGSAGFDVIVLDRTAPALTVPGDRTAEASSPAGAVVTFAASATDLVDGNIVPECSPASGATFALGRTTVTCTARDAAGNSATGTFDVIVADTTAPVITQFAPSQSVLWPPNHQMVALTLRVSVSDKADASPACAITSIRSNEAVNGTGDGNTGPDWSFNGLSFALRAERAGSGPGRIYTIDGECCDSAGNVTRASTTLLVPKSMGGK